jgi:hypothetical protein
MGRRQPELTRAAFGRPQLQKPKAKAFTKDKEDRFLAALAATCNVARSARRARVSKAAVYDRRQKSAAFRARWAAAVSEAYASLELAMLERMMNGTVKTVRRADGSVDETRDYPNAIALQLLRLHRDTAAEADREHDPEEIDEVRQRLAERIERLRQRIEAETKRGPAGDAAPDASPAPDDA